MSNNKSLADFFNAIDPEKFAIEKAKKVGKQLEQDLYNKAIEGVYEYYSGYKPKIYNKRTYSLANTVKSFYREGRSNGDFTVTCGVEFDPDVLIGVHSSKSIKHQSGSTWKSVWGIPFDDAGANNGIPGYEWIFDNFYDSKHPVFNYKTGVQGYEQAPSQQQWKLMSDYLDSAEFGAKADALMLVSLSDFT